MLMGCTSLATTHCQNLDIADFAHIIQLSDAEIAPDGFSAVFLHSRTILDENRNENQLMFIDLLTKNIRPLIMSRPGLAAPKWSPKGDQVAFLANVQGVRQVFILPMGGGESRQVSFSETAVKTYAWAPGADRIAYIAEGKPKEPETGLERFNDAFEIGSDHFLTKNTPANSHVWIVDLNTGQAKQWTPDSLRVATGLRTSTLSWSPDGKWLAMVGFDSSHPGDSDLSRIYLLHTTTGEIKPASELQTMQGDPQFSPLGNVLTFSYPRDGNPANVTEQYQVTLRFGDVGNQTVTLDKDITAWYWLTDGRALALAPEGLKSSLWLKEAAHSFQRVELGEVSHVSHLSVGERGAMVFIGAEENRPTELYYKPSLASEVVRLTRYNQHIADKKQGKREPFSWSSSNGLTPDGVITYPPDFDATKRYPLVVYLHGGPTAYSDLSFNLPAQLLAAKGWVVLQPNYRGSNNLGNVFQSAIAGDAAEGPGQDVMAGILALRQLGFIDPNKMAVCGWSYGGWMTAWMIGRYPDTWAAAVAGAAPVDLTDMYSLSDLNRMRRHAITDSPYKGNNLQAAYEQSPIIHFPKLRTPTLLLSKTDDSRVAITGSYKLYHALRDNGVATQFIAYPGPGHFPSDPVRTQDVWRRWLEWLERYL